MGDLAPEPPGTRKGTTKNFAQAETPGVGGTRLHCRTISRLSADSGRSWNRDRAAGEDFLPMREAMRALGVSRQTVLQRVKRGELAAGQETFAGVRDNGRDAPDAVTPKVLGRHAGRRQRPAAGGWLSRSGRAASSVRRCRWAVVRQVVRDAGSRTARSEHGVDLDQEASGSVRAQAAHHRNSVSLRPRARPAMLPAQYRPTQGPRPAVMAGFRWRHADPSVPLRGCGRANSQLRAASPGTKSVSSCLSVGRCWETLWSCPFLEGLLHE